MTDAETYREKNTGEHGRSSKDGGLPVARSTEQSVGASGAVTRKCAKESDEDEGGRHENTTLGWKEEAKN